MSQVKRTGVFTGKDFPELKATGQARGFVFSGSNLPSTQLALGIVDSAGVFIPFTGAIVTTLTGDNNFLVNAQPPADGLALNVEGGSPDFIMTAFNAGPIVG